MIKNVVKFIGAIAIGFVMALLGALSCACLYFKFGWTGNVKMGSFVLAIIAIAIDGKLTEDFNYAVDKYFYEKQKESR